MMPNACHLQTRLARNCDKKPTPAGLSRLREEPVQGLLDAQAPATRALR